MSQDDVRVLATPAEAANSREVHSTEPVSADAVPTGVGGSIAPFMRAAANLLRRLRQVTGPLLLVAAVFLPAAALATWGKWLGFPLGAPLTAHDLRLTFDDREISLAAVLIVLSTASALLMLVSRATAVVLQCASLIALAIVPFQAGMLSTGLAVDYARESRARQELGDFITNAFLPNQSLEPQFEPMLQYESLLDQLNAGLAMLGWGFYISLFGTTGLLLVSLRYWRFPYRFYGVVALLSAFGVLSPLGNLWSLVSAEIAHRKGDYHLVRGRAEQAVLEYSAALDQNEALSDSTPFLIKCAIALDGASGGRHALSQLAPEAYLVEQRSMSRSEGTYQAARSRLLSTWEMGPASTNLEKALARLAYRLDSELWRQEGLVEARAGRWTQSLGALFRSGLSDENLTMFYAAVAYMKLGEADAAIDLLELIEKRIHHPSFKADVRCTLGDAYTLRGEVLQAREAYIACKDSDKSDNYRVLRALSGL